MNRNYTSPLFSAILLCVLMSGCSSSPQVYSNQAPGFQVSNYRTYDYYNPLSTDLGGTRSLNSRALIEATDEQLQQRGLKRDRQNPELLVNFIGTTEEKISSRPSSTPSMYYGRSRYGTWGGYGMGVGNTTEVVQKTVGTLSVDIVDAARDELVWEGAATAVITDSMRKNKFEGLKAAIAAILAQIPLLGAEGAPAD